MNEKFLSPYEMDSDDIQINEFGKSESEGLNEGTKSKKFFLTINSALNRGVIHTFHVSKYPISIGTTFNKNSNVVQFQLDSEIPVIKDKIVNVVMFRRLEESIFRKMFLKMERIQEGEIDYKYNFIGLKPIFSNRLIQIMNEHYNLFVDSKKSENKKNELEFYAWKLQDVDNDIIFFLVQRKFYNKISRIFTIRSYAMQIFTQRGEEILNRYYEDFEKSMGKDKIDIEV